MATGCASTSRSASTGTRTRCGGSRKIPRSRATSRPTPSVGSSAGTAREIGFPQVPELFESFDPNQRFRERRAQARRRRRYRQLAGLGLLVVLLLAVAAMAIGATTVIRSATDQSSSERTAAPKPKKKQPKQPRP